MPQSVLLAGPLAHGLTLRDADAIDKSILFAWYEQAYREHIEQLWGWDTRWQQRDFTRLFETLTPRVIMRDGRGTGYVQTQQRESALHLVNIVIRPAARSQGIGATIIHALQSRAAAENRAVTLKVFRTNDGALAFYRRHGFHRTGCSSTHFEMCWHEGVAAG